MLLFNNYTYERGIAMEEKKRCPRCGGTNTWEVSKAHKPGVWYCSDCKKDFNRVAEDGRLY